MSQSTGENSTKAKLEELLHTLSEQLPAHTRAQLQEVVRQAELVGQERMFEASSTPKYIVSFDDTTQSGKPYPILAANAAAQKFYGHSADEFRQLSLLDMRSEHEQARLQAHLASIEVRNEVRPVGTWVHKKKNGEEAHVLVNISPWYNGSGKKMLVAAQDITSQITSQRVLEESEERMHAILDTSQAMTIVTDADGHIVYYNTAVEKVTGYKLEERIGASAFENVHPHDLARVLQLIQQPTARAEVRVRRADGQYRTYELSSSNQVNNPLVRGYVISGMDVEDRIQLQEQLVQAQKMEAVGTLAGGVAHDFNNLLTVISANAEFISFEDVGDDVRENVKEIKHAASRAATLTRQLLEFSRKSPHQPRTMDLTECITSNEKMLRRLLLESIDYTTHGAKDVYVHADPTKIEQVVMNLVVNARDALPNNRGHIRVGVQRQAVLREDNSKQGLKPGTYALLTVTDDGIGMNHDTKSKVFEPFFTTKEPGKGTGLGLATVYGIVKQSGGYIYVHSQEGKGTKFSVYLPLVRPQEQQEAPVPTAQSTQEQGRVLLVEDEPSIRSVAKRMLERQGLTVYDFGHPASALEFAKQTSVDLLVTDMVMPGMTGTELSTLLKQRQLALPVIYMSGHPRDQSIEALGPREEYIQKPFAMSDLGASVQRLLRTKD